MDHHIEIINPIFYPLSFHTMKTFFGILTLSILYVTIFTIWFYRNEKLQEQRNQLYTCDAYAYDIQNAPEFCK